MKYVPKNDSEAIEAMKSLVEAIACGDSDETIESLTVFVAVGSEDEPMAISAQELASDLFEYSTTG